MVSDFNGQTEHIFELEVNEFEVTHYHKVLTHIIWNLSYSSYKRQNYTQKH